MKIRNAGFALATALLGFATAPVFAGGGGSGTHYFCFSEKLGISFQLSHRPEKIHFPKGTPILVNEPIYKAGFYNVTSFVESENTVTLKMKIPAPGQIRNIVVEWKGNSILENIEMTYVNGMHLDTATDGKCSLLD